MNREPQRLDWFEFNSRFAGKDIRLDNGELLELVVFIWPDGDYTYLAVPKDRKLRRSFARQLLGYPP